MDKKTHDKGLEIRKAVLGEAYVSNALKNADDFNKPFQELVTEYCWGAVWGREELPRKTRSMLNLAMISILNRPHELRVHIKGALVNGVTKDEIRACRWRSMPACRRASTVFGLRAKYSLKSTRAKSTWAKGVSSWISDSSASGKWAFPWPAA
jgi:4-carboxymuconolactone decarboxylase